MKVGFIGTGTLGAPMAARLASQGISVVAWNRTESKATPLRKHGVRVVATVGGALETTDIVIVMLADAAAVRDVLFPAGSSEQLAGRTIVQMGTIGPDESRAFAVMAERAGATWVEAPVLGSVPQAESGELIVLFGGSSAGLERVAPVLRHLGPVTRVGDVGDAALVKLALNQIIGALCTGFSASLALVRRAGLDQELFMGALRQSSFYAPTFDAKLPRMLARDFAKPNFPAIHMLKDLDLFLAEAEARGLGTDGVAGVRQVVAAAVGMGHAESDYSAIYEAVDPPVSE